jgi:hypothetical protein
MARSFAGSHGSPQWGRQRAGTGVGKDVRICRNEHVVRAHEHALQDMTIRRSVIAWFSRNRR